MNTLRATTTRPPSITKLAPMRKAAHHAHVAHGHHIHATEHAENAAKEHVKAHGAK